LSVQRREAQQVSVRFFRRDHRSNTTRARDSEQIIIPRRLRGVGGQGTVGAVNGDELCEIREEVH
jgi:hypothetical protein